LNDKREIKEVNKRIRNYYNLLKPHKQRVAIFFELSDTLYTQKTDTIT